jgi:hypothetical protein
VAAGQALLGLIVAVIPRHWPIALAADNAKGESNLNRINLFRALRGVGPLKRLVHQNSSGIPSATA